MKTKLTNSAVYIAKTMFFFGLVGALIGTALLAPFADVITHRPFRFPDTLYLLLIGYLILGVPIAATTGLIYGLCLVSFDASIQRRFHFAFASGMILPLVLVFSDYLWNPRTPLDSLVVICVLMLFFGFSALLTAWMHRKAEGRFRFLQIAALGESSLQGLKAAV